MRTAKETFRDPTMLPSCDCAVTHLVYLLHLKYSLSQKGVLVGRSESVIFE